MCEFTVEEVLVIAIGCVGIVLVGYWMIKELKYSDRYKDIEL